jgi:hypothetical protein
MEKAVAHGLPLQLPHGLVSYNKYPFQILEGAVGKNIEEGIRTICERKDSEIEN